MLSRRALFVGILGVLVAPRSLLARRKQKKRKHENSHRDHSVLVSKFMEGRIWNPAAPEIVVVNHSIFPADDVTAAVGLWQLPRVPSLRVVQAEPLPCSKLRAQRGVVLLCMGPATDALIGGRMFSYTNQRVAHNKRKTHARQQYREAAIVWIVDRHETSSAVRRNVVAHEVGHALGLPHLSCDCVMSPDARGYTTLAPEDLAALRLLYP